MAKKELPNKKDFIDKMAELFGIKKNEAETIIERFLETATVLVRESDGFKLLGYFIVDTKDVEECSRPNPQNRDEIVTTPAHKKVRCKIGKVLQSVAN